MDLQITPEPTEAERAAILRALELESGKADREEPAWWRAGLEPEEDYATTPPLRQSRGATRA